MPELFIISGCNGAGKTTASYTVLPELLYVREFVNADEIARGLSPFQPEKAAVAAGRIMLRRIDDLMVLREDFAFETTLSTRSFVGLIQRAKAAGYTINLIYYWLDSPELAKERVRSRVAEGGHSIPDLTITRRYYAGISNFMRLYKDIADFWLLIDNSNTTPEVIAERSETGEAGVASPEKWHTFITLADHEAH
ncbi:zeta toxin family protein [Hymenobacter sp. BT507]|uniref:Zeta toxin family protein n=1 Tax=Hymenobacter citatus TaxID=2763506 RepID=A0ABR7MHI4_9BACT|nr:zeta toxin family protein [Hymenobacter citatus]MBC6610546.1 zeta toxin family protein [Hymenobacter citatus]